MPAMQHSLRARKLHLSEPPSKQPLTESNSGCNLCCLLSSSARVCAASIDLWFFQQSPPAAQWWFLPPTLTASCPAVQGIRLHSCSPAGFQVFWRRQLSGGPQSLYRDIVKHPAAKRRLGPCPSSPAHAGWEQCIGQSGRDAAAGSHLRRWVLGLESQFGLQAKGFLCSVQS